MKRLIPAVICIVALALALSGCGISVGLGGLGTRYDVNEEKELDAAGARSIKISTVSDDIIVRSGGDKVLARLTGECRTTSKPVWLDARRSGDDVVIEVEYPIGITNCNTMLEVTIPEGFAGDFEAGAVSGDVEADGLPFKLGEVYVHTISGAIRFSTVTSTRVKAETTSGGITLSRLACETDAHSISGNIELDYDTFAASKAGAVSGGVEVTLPQEAAFRVQFDSVSGNFSSTHAGVDVNHADGGFTADANGGGELLKVNTTSGGFRLAGK